MLRKLLIGIGVLNFARNIERVLPAHVVLARWLGVAAGVAFLAPAAR